RSRANKVGDAAIPAGQGSPLLGHADIRITSRHDAHLRCRTLANAVNAVNALLPDFGAIAQSNVAAIGEEVAMRRTGETCP
ncbi:MAG TPA: hypothetical protein VFN86_11295, partial [Casimicrobiaceae bacterium]|nr:hypothetical protein [Casimicrobiaceae bacterium]